MLNKIIKIFDRTTPSGGNLTDPSTPDHLIVARICRLMMERTTGWYVNNPPSIWERKSDYLLPMMKTMQLQDRHHNINRRVIDITYLEEHIHVKVVYAIKIAGKNGHLIKYPKTFFPYAYEVKLLTVNDVDLLPELGKEVVQTWATALKIMELDAEVREDMQENEEKWNLVERLLKMKRTETGALVPIEQVEDNPPSEKVELVEPFKNICEHSHGWCEICAPEKVLTVKTGE